MSDFHSRIWIAKLLKKIPLPYPIVSLIVGCIIYMVYFFFSTKVVFSQEKFYFFHAASLSILIPIQIVGIQYILNGMEKTYKEEEQSFDYNFDYKDVDWVLGAFDSFRHRFSTSLWYYILAATVIIPFIIIEVLNISSNDIYFYTVEQTIWSFFLDIYDNAIGYLMLFLLVIILWIILNITWILYDFEGYIGKRFKGIDTFNVDNFGGLKPLKDSILRISIFYLIIIVLAIISSISSFNFFTYEFFFFIILLLVGEGFSLLGLIKIRRLVKSKFIDEIDKINYQYKKQHDRLLKIISEGNSDKEAIKLISKTLEILALERERILGIGVLGKIQDKSMLLYNQTKNTPFEYLGKEVNNISQTLLQTRDPKTFEKSFSTLQVVLSNISKKMPEEEIGINQLLKKANEEKMFEDRLNLINVILGIVSSNIGKEKAKYLAEKGGIINVTEKFVGGDEIIANNSSVVNKSSYANAINYMRDSGNAEAAKAIDDLVKLIKNTDFKDKEETLDAVESLAEEAAKPNPKKGTLRMLGESILKIVEKIPEIVEKATPLMKIISKLWLL